MLGDDDARLGAANDGYRTERGWWFPGRTPATIADAGLQYDAGTAFDTVQITPRGGPSRCGSTGQRI